MRVSWTKARGLTVLMATVVALQGAGVANAQDARYGYQKQIQPQPTAQRPVVTAQTAQPKADLRYTTTSYLQGESGVLESLPPSSITLP